MHAPTLPCTLPYTLPTTLPCTLPYTLTYTSLGNLPSATLPRTLPHALPCTLYIGVLGYANATYSIMASIHDDRVLRLIDGQAQTGLLEQDEWKYYRYALANGTTGFRVSVQPNYGDPDVFIASGGVTPTSLHYGWAGTARRSNSALHTRLDDRAPCTRLVARGAQAAPTHPGAPPLPLGGSPWPPQPASGRSEAEAFPPCRP